MIAYNYYIDFIPKLKYGENTTNSIENIVTIEEISSFNFHDKLLHKMNFFNNQGREMSLYCDKEFSHSKKGKYWCFEVENVVSFFWESGKKILSYVPHEQFTASLLKYWTLHIVLPIFFTIEEIYDFLHAGAVEINGMPVLFIAESYGGKSTMTDFFIKQGHTMISDDKVASFENNEEFFAVSAYPYHRPYRKLEDLGHFVTNVAKIPKPIHVIYELDRVEKNNPITINELHGLEKFKALCYSTEFKLPFLKPRQFGFFSRLVKTVPVYKITVPWDLNRLDEVYKKICDHSIAVK